MEQIKYTCPMHPEVKQDKPGICPECGMNLVPEKIKEEKDEEYNRHGGHKQELFLRKFWVSFILTIPVLLYSELVRKFLPIFLPSFQILNFDFGNLLSLILGSIVFFYGGWVFIQSAWRELKAKLPGMMTLITLAISAAYLYSVFAVLVGKGHTLFWELTTLITIMLLGHWIEMKAVQGAQSALKELSKLLPDTAEVIRGEKMVILPLAELRVGDIVFVRPGAKIPADGIVIEGKSDVNEAIVTGESKPVQKVINSEVIAGTINGDGSLKAKVTKIGENTFLAGVMRLVSEAQASKSRLQLLSDKAAFYLTLIAIFIGGLTFLAWLIARKGIVFAVERLVAVLVITCPHALGLAIPLVASISTTLAARSGFLVKQRLALEAARETDIVLFDKTGTLTEGIYGVERIWSIAVKTQEDILKLAASVDIHSEHFIAKAIVVEAKKRGIEFPKADDFQRVPGRGAEGKVGGERVLVGGAAILDYVGLKLPLESKTMIEEESRKGKTIIFVIKGEKLAGVMALADLIRTESRQAIKVLKDMGIKSAMITGDSADVAAWVAGELGIDEYFSRVLPENKAEKVKALQIKGLKVAMVGDGINDAPALTQADLGIAIGAGTNVAIESAGIILVRNDPRDIPKIIKLSRLTYTKMIQNLFWATGYNLIALPLAAGILAFKGILLQPALAALFMSLSTVIVAINAMLLRRNVL